MAMIPIGHFRYLSSKVGGYGKNNEVDNKEDKNAKMGCLSVIIVLIAFVIALFCAYC